MLSDGTGEQAGEGYSLVVLNVLFFKVSSPIQRLSFFSIFPTQLFQCLGPVFSNSQARFDSAKVNLFGLYSLF